MISVTCEVFYEIPWETIGVVKRKDLLTGDRLLECGAPIAVQTLRSFEPAGFLNPFYKPIRAEVRKFLKGFGKTFALQLLEQSVDPLTASSCENCLKFTLTAL